VTASKKTIVALARGIKVLETLSNAEGPMSNSQIVRATGYAPSTVSRLTASLVELGYLRISQNTYVLTPKNLSLGYPVLAGAANTSRAQRVLDDLAARTGFSTGYAIRDRLYVTFLVVSRPSSPRAVNVAVGARLPVAASASGIAILSAIDEPDRTRLMRRIHAELRERNFSIDQFQQAIDDAVNNSYAITTGLWRSDIAAMAVPVRSGGELHALTVIARTQQLTEGNQEKILDSLQDVSTWISD